MDTNANAVGKFIIFYEGTTTTPRNPIFMERCVYEVVGKKGTHKILIEQRFCAFDYVPALTDRKSALTGGHIALVFPDLESAKEACGKIGAAKMVYENTIESYTDELQKIVTAANAPKMPARVRQRPS